MNYSHPYRPPVMERIPMNPAGMMLTGPTPMMQQPMPPMYHHQLSPAPFSPYPMAPQPVFQGYYAHYMPPCPAPPVNPLYHKRERKPLNIVSQNAKDEVKVHTEQLGPSSVGATPDVVQYSSQGGDKVLENGKNEGNRLEEPHGVREEKDNDDVEEERAFDPNRSDGRDIAGDGGGKVAGNGGGEVAGDGGGEVAGDGGGKVAGNGGGEVAGDGGGKVAGNGGGKVAGDGGGEVASNGGGKVADDGGGEVAGNGGGKVAGNGGGEVADDGGSKVADDGGGEVARNGGGKVAGNGGGEVAGNGGGEVAGNGGGEVADDGGGEVAGDGGGKVAGDGGGEVADDGGGEVADDGEGEVAGDGGGEVAGDGGSKVADDGGGEVAGNGEGKVAGEEDNDLKQSFNEASLLLRPVEDVQPYVQQTELQEDGAKRIRYDREYLLQLRRKRICWIPPQELLSKECYCPSEATYGSGQKNGRQGEESETRRIITYAVPEKVLLREAEQPWQKLGDLQLELTEGQKTTHEVFRKFQSILNKLTSQNFQKLADMTLQLKINTEERLRGVVGKIFTKALEEINFIPLYAKLCQVLALIKVESLCQTGKPKTITFRHLLFDKCQQEFEKDKQEDEEREAMQKGIEAAETEEIRKQRQQELEAAETTSRHRSLGNMRLIGELYKLKMISQTTLHGYMVQLLLSPTDEKSLECFAVLMTTTGNELDRGGAKCRMDQYISRVYDIIRKRKVSLRTKFALQDVVDLRENKWVPLDHQCRKKPTSMRKARERNTRSRPLDGCQWQGYSLRISSHLKNHFFIGWNVPRKIQMMINLH